MPIAPRRPCVHPSCGELTTTGRCDRHKLRRPSSASRGYTHEYRKFRADFLERHTTCESSRGCSNPATELHHPHRLIDGADACDEQNAQALCDVCHNSLGGKGGWL